MSAPKANVAVIVAVVRTVVDDALAAMVFVVVVERVEVACAAGGNMAWIVLNAVVGDNFANGFH